MKRVPARMFGPQFTCEAVTSAGNLAPCISLEAAQINGIADAPRHARAFHDQYIPELQLELTRRRAEVAALPGVLDTFSLIRQRLAQRGDVELGLLTGNYTQAVPLKLEAVGVDPAWFTVTAFGDEGATRPHLVEVAMRKFSAMTGSHTPAKRVVVIGDTPRDVHCAKVHGCIAFAVATGGHSVDELKESGADVTVRDLSDPQPLVTLIDSLAS